MQAEQQARRTTRDSKAPLAVAPVPAPSPNELDGTWQVVSLLLDYPDAVLVERVPKDLDIRILPVQARMVAGHRLALPGHELRAADLGDAEGDRLAILLRQGLPGAPQEALEVITAVKARFDLKSSGITRFTHFNKGGEEIVHSIAELLHVGVLVGGALVAVDGDALIHLFAIAIMLLAQ